MAEAKDKTCTPRDLWESFPESEVVPRLRHGRAAPEQLLEALRHHTCRTVQLHTGWGIVALPREQAIQRLVSALRPGGSVEAFRGRHPEGPVYISVSVAAQHLSEWGPKHPAYEFTVDEDMAVDVPGEDKAWHAWIY